MKRLVIYVHGKGGSAEEAKHYRPLFAESDVIGFDYHAQTPWEAKYEFPRFFDLHSKGYDSVILIANSIGAYFSMNALAGKKISQVYFAHRRHGTAHYRYDDVGQGNRGGAGKQKGDSYRVWRNLILGVSVLCAKATHQMEHPYPHFVWGKGSPDFQRNHFRIRGPNWRRPHRNGGRRTLVPYRGANERP